MADKGSAIGRVIALVGIAGLSATPVQAHVERERQALEARVEAVRQGLKSQPAATRSLVAQAANWNNWPKWSKWSNWANQ